MGRLRRTHVHFALALVALVLAHPTPMTNALGAVLVALGLVVRVWAAGVLEKGSGLCIDGPYRWVRHPLYLGSFVAAVGLCVMANSVWGWLIILPVFIILYWGQMMHEERRLAREFGGLHAEYARTVPMILPMLPRTAGGGRGWRFGRMLVNRELHHVAVTCSLAALFYFRDLLPRV